MPDYDSPWKEALDVYFQAFVALFFSAIHSDIDWSRGYESLDKELQQVAPKAARGRRTVDKLVKVWRKNGREAWVLIHVEVQTGRDPRFAQRMYIYNCRIFDRYNRRAISLAVLADDDPSWRPEQYEDELWGWSVRMHWPAVKLLDYANREAALEEESNPFAKVVLAHLKALQTRRDPATRRFWKFRLVRGLYERGFSAENVRQLFRLIDWLMELPSPAQRAFRRELDEFEEGRRMPYVTSIERDGMLRVIEHALRVKFGEEGAALVPGIEEMNDADKYLAVHEAILKADDLDDVRRACAAAAGSSSARKRKKSADSKRGRERD